MPLSRHFYPVEDVHAALRYSVCRSQPSESVFWCQELLWSGCASEAVSALFESWLWQIGPFRMAWLFSAWNTLATEEVTEDAIRLAAYQLGTLTSSQRDHSLWQLLVLGAASYASYDPPDHITRKSPITLPSNDDKEIYLIRAMYQGKARCAWWMALQLSPPRVWELVSWYITTLVTDGSRVVMESCVKALQEYEPLLGYQSEEYDVVMRCLGVLMCCLSPSQRQESTRPMAVALDTHVTRQCSEWDALYGTKRARVYSLSTSCLYGTTWRGTHKWSQQNRTQLYQVERYLVGCPFWDEAIAEYGVVQNGSIQWHSEDAMETYYERYFPDDIPDEWTREEKQISHGDGILGPNETVSLSNYAARFLCVPSRFTWGYLGQVQTYLRTLAGTETECHPCSIIQAYSKIHDISCNREWITPVHKIKRIVR